MKKILALMALGVLILAFSGTSARANGAVNPLLVLTENSSSDLTATMAGVPLGAVTNLSPDTWVWIPPAPPGTSLVGLTLSTITGWAEPDVTIPLGNFIFLFGFGPFGFDIVSDVASIPFPGAPSFVPDGSIQASAITAGFSDNTSITYDVQFFDRGDAPVPEPSTMLLLGSGLIGLAGYGRIKFFTK